MASVSMLFPSVLTNPISAGDGGCMTLGIVSYRAQSEMIPSTLLGTRWALALGAPLRCSAGILQSQWRCRAAFWPPGSTEAAVSWQHSLRGTVAAGVSFHVLVELGTMPLCWWLGAAWQLRAMQAELCLVTSAIVLRALQPASADVFTVFKLISIQGFFPSSCVLAL